MAVGNFLRCHEITAKWEGGWSNHKADPGGATMYGITIGKYREHYPKATAADLRRISYSSALEIYRKDFWSSMGCENMHAGVDLAVYDAAVNSGPGRARKWLLASVGEDAATTVKRVCAKRLGFVRALKTWATFGKGWSRRIADIEAKGVAMAMSVTRATAPKVTKTRLETEAHEAEKVAKQQKGGGAVVGGGGAAAGLDQADQLASWALGGAFVLVVLAVGFLIWRSKVNSARAAAYAAEAAKI